MKQQKRYWALLCAMLLLFCQGALAQEAENLIDNGSFEEVDASGGPTGWYMKAYRTQEGYTRIGISQERAHSGENSLMIENASENDARYVFDATVEPQSMYRLSGYIWVESMEEGGNGANLGIEDAFAHSPPLHSTGGQWHYVECYGETDAGQRSVAIGVRIGGYSAESAGKAYFDDIRLEKVQTLPGGLTAGLWFTMAPSAQVEQEDTAPGKEKSTLLFVLGAVLFGLLALCLSGLLEGRQEALAPQDRQAKGSWMLLLFLGLLMLVALGARIALACFVEGYQVDINCFTAWSLRMAQVGPAEFYAADYFCDYPPGYMLLLWPVGLLLQVVGSNRMLQLLVVKGIPILCDMLIALLLFVFAKKRIPARAAAFVSMLYALNPAVLVNGAAWGQVDCVLAGLMMLAAVYAMRRKWMVAIPAFVLGALVKPQALLLAPVGGMFLIMSLVRDSKRTKQLKQMLWGILIGMGCLLAIVLPFAVRKPYPFQWMVELYGNTLGSYSYVTLNTANLYYLLGCNWKPLETDTGLWLPLITGILSLGLGGWRLLASRRGESGGLVAGRAASQGGSGALEKPGSLQKRRRALAWLCLGVGTLFVGMSLLKGTYLLYGTLMMLFAFAWALICVIGDSRREGLPFYMALALIGVYVLGIKIHERYLFVALPLLLLGYTTTQDKRLLGLCVGFSITTFLNTAIVLDNSILFGSSNGHLNGDTLPLNVVLCIFNLLLCGYAGYISFTGLRQSQSQTAQEGAEGSRPSLGRTASYRQALLSPRDARLHLGKRDWLIMAVVTALYACLAFTNLGSTEAPQNGWISTSAQEQIVFQVNTEQPYKLAYFGGVNYSNFYVAVSDDGENWSEEFPCDMREGLCYRWNYAINARPNGDFMADAPENVLWLTGQYLRLTAGSVGLNLLEIIARDEEGQTVPMQVKAHTGAKDSVLSEPKPPENLLDEQHTMEGEPGWYNSTYFDEIYHARTAYEHLHGINPYETTHPPLGKLLMSVGIAIFGMTPFGWRFAGTFIGVLMLPAMYLLAKQLTRKRDLSAFAMLLMAFDLMHFTQTRIATIDSFPVFFIILSYLCMARYLMGDWLALRQGEALRLWTAAYWRSLVPLALGGLMMGLSIASKWIGLYSAVGLAVLFFVAIYRQYRMASVSYDVDLWDGTLALTEGQRLRMQNAQQFTTKRMLLTCGLCLVFFVGVPALVYYLSYIPYLAPTGQVSWQRIWQAQEGMLNYHSTPGLGMDHPFQSPWWQWPFIGKPMWFAQDKHEPAGYASTIMCMGNPLIFYVGAVAMVLVFVGFVRKYLSFQRGVQLRGTDGNMMLAVLVVGFLAQYLPWVLVPRSMYIYHYFASVPFIIMATAWVASFLPEGKRKLRQGVLWGYVALAAAFFVMFYPYASGMLTSREWLHFAKWFPGLYF